MKEGFDSISKFKKDRESVATSMRDLEIKMEVFTNSMWTIDGVSRYFGSKSNMNTDLLNHNFSQNFSMIKNFLNNYREDEKKIFDLDPIKKCIEDQKLYMSKFLELKDSNPEKISEYFKGESSDREKKYKDIVGQNKPPAYTKERDFYSTSISFGERFREKNITLNEIKEVYDKETKVLNKKSEVIKGFAESSFIFKKPRNL